MEAGFNWDLVGCGKKRGQRATSKREEAKCRRGGVYWSRVVELHSAARVEYHRTVEPEVAGDDADRKTAMCGVARRSSGERRQSRRAMEEIRERRHATILSFCEMEEICRLMVDLRHKDRRCDRGLCETDQRCDDCARG
ncbi:hypothetical protein U1Q18_027418, partial [Sarracenia purpurea var. burkii]